MANPVAPGSDGYNLLSKRHLFRVVVMNDLVDDEDKPLKGPMVLEAEDGSYLHEIEFEDARKDGRTKVFEFQVKLRRKKYFCYLKDASRKFKWNLLPIGMAVFEEIGAEEEATEAGA